MEWMCGWCGKPHAEDEPPCDQCGHGTFERAVVQEPAPVDAGPSYVWRCTACGRDHPKHAPPCSRCGNGQLARTEQTYEDVERDLASASWIAVAKPYLPVFAIAIVAVGLVATGVVSLSSLPGIGPDDPALPEAPGSATEANGLDLEAVATSVHESLEAERADRAGSSRTMDASMVHIAAYTNRAFMRQTYGDGFDPDGDESFSAPCSSEQIEVALPLTGDDISISAYKHEDRLADDIVDELLEDSTPSETMALSSTYTHEGIDVHVGPYGYVSLAYVSC